MDDESRSIVDAAYERTLDLIREQKQDVAKVDQLLMDKETITHDDILHLVGPRPYKGDSAYQQYVTSKGAVGTKKEADNAEEDAASSSSPVEEENSGGFAPGLA
jgi:AFG3 family protein